MAKVMQSKITMNMEENIKSKEFVKDLTKEEASFMEQEYSSGKFSPRDIWELRDKKNLNAYEKRIVYHDDLVIEALRLEKMNAEKITTPLERYGRGITLRGQNSADPYGDIPLCKPLRKGGDPREDVFCLTKEEREMLEGNKYGYTEDKHPDLKFLVPFTDTNLPPNMTAIYYSNYDNNGVPKNTSKKYTARFYGEFDDEPFTELSLHKDKGSDKERKIVNPRVFADTVRKHQKIEAKNREKVIAEGNAGKYKFFEGIDEMELDKPRTRDDGTDTFRDVITIHDAPHSVALYLEEIRKEAHRKKEEKNRQFAFHNIVSLSFPWGLEYVKYYTQGAEGVDVPKKFPLVVSSLMKSSEEMLEDNGLPKAMARWCTNQYKLYPSDFFYKATHLDGVLQRVGMTRFQGRGRFHMKPYTTIWEKTAKINRSKIKGHKDALHKANLPDYDEDGYPIEYQVKYDDDKHLWLIKYQGANPNIRVYQNLPIFDTTEDEQLDTMVKHKVDINPLITKFDFHGCLLCPHRSVDYFRCLRDRNRELYDIADNMRKAGSKRNLLQGKKEYYYFYQPYETDKEGNVTREIPIEEAYKKKPENFIFDDDGKLRPVM